LLCSDNIVVEYPAIQATDNGLEQQIYREYGLDPDSDYTCFIFFQNNLLGTPEITLINDAELVKLTAHTSAPIHWDLTNRMGLCVCLNTAITTPDTTPLSNTTDATIKATAWNLNHPSRFIVKIESDGSLTYTYNSRIDRNLLLIGVVECVRIAGNTTITITPQIDTGSGWTSITEDAQDIVMSAAVDRAGRTFPISRKWKFGDKLRFVTRTDVGSYYVENHKCKTDYPNA